MYARHADPGAEVDMRIATAMGRIFWLGGAVLAGAMLALAPPTRVIGPVGWAVAAPSVRGSIVIGVLRILKPPPSNVGSLFAGSVLALVGIAVLEWLAGGRGNALPVPLRAARALRRRGPAPLARSARPRPSCAS